MGEPPARRVALRTGDALLGAGVALAGCSLVGLLQLERYVPPPVWLLAGVACAAAGGWLRSGGR